MPRLLIWLAVLAGFLGIPARAAEPPWVRGESPNFVLYTDVGQEKARGYLQTLELFDHALRTRHGLSTAEPARRKLPIYLLRREGDMRKIRPISGADGFYSSHLEDTYAVASAAGKDNSVLLHEYVHHFMLQQFPYGYPAWLVEGYAEYFMTFEVEGDRYSVGRPHPNRAQWLVNARWLPLKVILNSGVRDLRSDEDRAMFYAQAWALTHYFMSAPERRVQLDRYLEGVARGLASGAAMQEATGLSVAALDRRVSAYLNKGIPYQKTLVGDFKPPAVSFTPLPAGAGDILLTTQRVKGDNGVDAPWDKTDGPVLLADARRAAARAPGDRAAELLLARAEIKLGDRAAGEAIVERRLAADPADVEALQVLIASKLRESESAPPARAKALLAQVRKLAGEAYAVEKDNYQILAAYARARAGLPSYPTENDVRVLADAVDLAPQVAEIRLNAARAMAARKEHAEAIRVLRPLAHNPHGGSEVETARAMLAEYEAQTGEAKGAGAGAP